MKTFELTILMLTVLASTAFSQGVITFGNHIPGILVAPVYGPEVDYVHHGGDWADAKTGNTATGTPAGTQIYNGALLQGWSVSFWAAIPGTDTTSGYLFQENSTTAIIGTGSDAGFFSTTPVTFSFLPSTGQATVQVRAWNSRGGTIPLWQVYWGDPSYTAVSALFTVDIGGFASNFRSFSAGFLDPLTFAPPIPEPSVFGLFAVGTLLLGCGFFCKRR